MKTHSNPLQQWRCVVVLWRARTLLRRADELRRALDAYRHQVETNRNTGGGTPHQRLLVAILNALGIMDTTFGEENTGSGPLSGYLA
jgi:hypothetical protein